MSSGQRETALHVFRQGKRRRLVPLQGVTGFATIRPGRILELTEMVVFVAVSATLKLNLEERSLARRDVALGASNCGMLLLQWIRRLVVIGQTERGWLPPFHRMTRRTLSAIRPLRELSRVWVGAMAIRTSLKRQCAFEIPAGMATRACNG